MTLSQEDKRCGKSDYPQDEVCLIATNMTGWCCLQATRAEANGSVSVCFSAAAGKQAPSCQVPDQPCYRALAAAPWSQRWMRSLYSNSSPVHRSCYGSALQIYIAQRSSDVRPHALFFCVSHRRFAPTLGTVEQNKHQNIVSIYI